MKKFENYTSALESLAKAGEQDLTNEFIQSGVIDKFSLQFELGWKLLKTLLAYEGEAVAATGSPREILKTAFRVYGFLDEGLWLSMLRERNNTAHIYDGAAAQRLVSTIISSYIPEFERLREGLLARYGEGMLLGPEL